MKIPGLVAALLFLSYHSFAQYWVAGDTTGFIRNVVEQTFQPDAEVKIDIDCDEVYDLRFYSFRGTQQNWHERLGFDIVPGVEVLNAASSFVTPFALGALPKGVYFLKILRPDGKKKVFRVVKN